MRTRMRWSMVAIIVGSLAGHCSAFIPVAPPAGHRIIGCTTRICANEGPSAPEAERSEAASTDSLSSADPLPQQLSEAGTPPQPSSPPQQPIEEKPTMKEYFLGKEGEFEADLRRAGISRKRFFLNTGAAAALALGANFLGSTSGLLGLLPKDTLDQSKLDRLYPVRGFYRYVDDEDDYEFLYPKSWLLDQAIAVAESSERAISVPTQDPLAPYQPPSTPRRRFRPDVAYGPPGGGYQENVSVVKTKVPIGSTLQGSFKDPREAAQFVLSTTIAPPGSGKNATLLSATSETREPGGTVYKFEYTVQKPGRFALRNLCAIAVRPSDGKLFTLLALAPESRWNEREKEIRQIVKSFRLLRP